MSSNAVAQQTQFYKQEIGNQLHFFYSWDDHEDKRYSLQYQVSKSLAFRHFTDFVRYTPETAQLHIAHALRGQTEAMASAGIKLNVNHQGSQLSYGISGGTQAMQTQWLEKLANIRQTAFDDYLSTINHTQFEGFANVPMVKPDHVKFATVSREMLVPLATAMRRQIPNYVSKRKQINYLLNFVQSIPYDPLTRRTHTTTEAFSPPMSMLRQNLGDCDSKATLFASLMRLLYPAGNVALVILPDHALIGVSLQPGPDDLTVDSERGKLVLLEVAGPAVVSAGIVGDSTRKAIETGQYKIEWVPSAAALDIEP